MRHGDSAACHVSTPHPDTREFQSALHISESTLHFLPGLLRFLSSAPRRLCYAVAKRTWNERAEFAAESNTRRAGRELRPNAAPVQNWVTTNRTGIFFTHIHLCVRCRTLSLGCFVRLPQNSNGSRRCQGTAAARTADTHAIADTVDYSMRAGWV